MSIVSSVPIPAAGAGSSAIPIGLPRVGECVPEVGHVFNADEEFGTVESVKAVSELFTPLSGEIVEVNKAAIAEPGIVNDDPFGDGWLIKMKLSTDEEVGKLMSAEDYAAYVQQEEKAR